MSSSSSNSCVSIIPQRWIFTILAGIGLCIQNIFTIIMAITIIEMVIKTTTLEVHDDSSNGNCPSEVRNVTLTNRTFSVSQISDDLSVKRYPWDEYTQGIILSSFAWSSTVVVFFYGALAERFGGKHIFGFGVLGQAVLTCITPLVINWGGASALIVTRAFAGLASDGMFPVVSRMIPHWSTPEERTRMGNAIFGASILGLFLGTIMPALIITYSGMGWPAVFYFIGILGIVWYPFWAILVYETPKVHPFISEKEFEYLQSHRAANDEKKTKQPAAPWRHILTCKGFWAFIIAYWGSNVTYYIMMSGLPRYLGNVIKFSIESNGYFSSVPYVIMWLNSILTTWISDTILERRWMSLTNVRKLLTAVSVTGPTLFLLFASYAECDKTTVVIMFMIGITLIGSAYPSLILNPMDLSPNYAGSLMSIGSGSAAVIAMLVPYMIGVLAPNSTLAEWRVVYWVAFFTGSVTTIIYLFWFKAEVQPWNESNFLRKETTTTTMNGKNKDDDGVELKLMS